MILDLDKKNEQLHQIHIAYDQVPLTDFKRNDHLIYLYDKDELSIEVINMYAGSSNFEMMAPYPKGKYSVNDITTNTFIVNDFLYYVNHNSQITRHHLPSNFTQFITDVKDVLEVFYLKNL